MFSKLGFNLRTFYFVFMYCLCAKDGSWLKRKLSNGYLSILWTYLLAHTHIWICMCVYSYLCWYFRHNFRFARQKLKSNKARYRKKKLCFKNFSGIRLLLSLYTQQLLGKLFAIAISIAI